MIKNASLTLEYKFHILKGTPNVKFLQNRLFVSYNFKHDKSIPQIVFGLQLSSVNSIRFHIFDRETALLETVINPYQIFSAFYIVAHKMTYKFLI